MHLNDARDVVQVRKQQEPQKIDPRLLAFAQERGRAGFGHTVGRPERGLMPGNICGYVNGRHVYASENCPHFSEQPREESEPGEQPIMFRPMRPVR